MKPRGKKEAEGEIKPVDGEFQNGEGLLSRSGRGVSLSEGMVVDEFL